MTLTHDHRDAPVTLPGPVAGTQPRPWARTLQAAALLQLALLAALSLLTGLGPAGWLAAAGYTAVVCALLAGAVRRAGRDRERERERTNVTAFGPADKVTLVRSALVGCVAGFVADGLHRPVPAGLLIGVTVVALLLDGVDGQVARRTGTASELGARFDMEVDAFLILVLSADVAERLGAWVLAIGLMRYAFAGAGRVLEWLRAPVPSSMAGKVVAAVQGVVLLVAAAGVLPAPVTVWLVAAALAALVWSFGRSVAWLHRKRVTARAAAARTRRGSGRGTGPFATVVRPDPA